MLVCFAFGGVKWNVCDFETYVEFNDEHGMCVVNVCLSM